MGFEIEGLDNFKNSLMDLVAVKFPEELELEILQIANRLLRKVKKRTPVGEYSDGNTGGDLRKHWQLGNLIKEGNQYYIEVINNLHYAPHVEFGHRTRLGKTSHPEKYKTNGTIYFVPGKFMLKISTEEINKELPMHLSNWLNKIIGELDL